MPALPAALLWAVPLAAAGKQATAEVFGGFYVDPNHYSAGSFAGTRMISDQQGDTPGSTLTLVGSDDGSSFWKIEGQWTDKAQGKLTVDFSPKGGPSGLTGTFAQGKITWQDGNHWSRQATPTFSTEDDTSPEFLIGGFYADPNHYQSGSFAGTRMISDKQGDTAGDVLTLVGSDDGTQFWTLTGHWTDKAAGKISVDFSPKGGPSDLQGTFSDSKITWQDGNHWSRQVVKVTTLS